MVDPASGPAALTDKDLAALVDRPPSGIRHYALSFASSADDVRRPGS